jgi:hypothetical protein
MLPNQHQPTPWGSSPPTPRLRPTITTQHTSRKAVAWKLPAPPFACRSSCRSTGGILPKDLIASRQEGQEAHASLHTCCTLHCCCCCCCCCWPAGAAAAQAAAEVSAAQGCLEASSLQVNVLMSNLGGGGHWVGGGVCGEHGHELASTWTVMW